MVCMCFNSLREFRILVTSSTIRSANSARSRFNSLREFRILVTVLKRKTRNHLGRKFQFPAGIQNPCDPSLWLPDGTPWSVFQFPAGIQNPCDQPQPPVLRGVVERFNSLREFRILVTARSVGPSATRLAGCKIERQRNTCPTPPHLACVPPCNPRHRAIERAPHNLNRCVARVIRDRMASIGRHTATALRIRTTGHAVYRLPSDSIPHIRRHTVCVT